LKRLSSLGIGEKLHAGIFDDLLPLVFSVGLSSVVESRRLDALFCLPDGSAPSRLRSEDHWTASREE
jgi:hypothetical protein